MKNGNSFELQIFFLYSLRSIHVSCVGYQVHAVVVHIALNLLEL